MTDREKNREAVRRFRERNEHRIEATLSPLASEALDRFMASSGARSKSHAINKLILQAERVLTSNGA